jgi:Tfp pilus assembly protein FimT
MPLENKYKNKQSGFTIIELIISAGIIAAISVLVIANFRGSDQKMTLNNEAERLASIIRTAHIDSLVGLSIAGIRPSGGFGVYLEQCSSACSYILFADMNGNHVYDGEPTDSLIQSLNMLDDNVYIQSLSPNDFLDIDFVPPLGEVYFDNRQTADEAIVTLRFANSDYIQSVSVNRLTGRIDVE